ITTYNPPTDFLENQIYFVTVITYNAVGNATACTETSFTTETIATVPDSTQLINPTDGETDVDTDITLEWTPSDTATDYIIIIGTIPGGSDVLNTNVGNVTTYNPNFDFDPDTTYYITIIATNANGDAINSPITTFTTAGIVDVVLPDCTEIFSIDNNQEQVLLNTPITWDAVPNATGYYINIGTVFSGGTNIENLTDLGNVTEYIPATNWLENLDYYITVIAYNTLGEAINCDEIHFKTEKATNADVFFTPNGDGENEYWTATNHYKTITIISIVDRFGKVLAQLKPTDIGWDGTYRGIQMPTNDYWYLIQFSDKSQVKGHFTLKR
ncbi:MAG: T9SS type B sorting domain-containing protein, partial [Flavobacteriaceae bacterium]